MLATMHQGVKQVPYTCNACTGMVPQACPMVLEESHTCGYEDACSWPGLHVCVPVEAGCVCLALLFAVAGSYMFCEIWRHLPKPTLKPCLVHVLSAPLAWHWKVCMVQARYARL